MLKITLIGSSLGAVVPLVCWVLNSLLKVTFGSWTLWICPSSIFLLSTDGAEHSLFSNLELVISILTNVLIYSLIAFVLALILHKLGVKN